MENITIIDPRQDSRWDEFVNNHPFGWITHLSGWKAVLEHSFKHIKGYYLTLVDSSTNKISAALPIFEVNSWLLGRRLVSMPFATISDPLVSNSDQMQQLFDAALEFARERKISEIEIRSHLLSPEMRHEAFEQNLNFKQHLMLLDKSPEQLLKTFHKNCVRKKIKHALEENLELRVAEQEQDMKNFYQLYLTLRKRLGLPPQPYRFFKNLWQQFFPSKNLELLMVTYNNQIVAGQIFFKFKDHVSVEFLAYDPDYRNLSLTHFLDWHNIRLAVEAGYAKLDFGRTSVFNENLMTFKGHWGTKVLDLPIYYHSDKNITKKSREESKTYGMVRTVCQKMPSPVFQAFGNFCYHHLG